MRVLVGVGLQTRECVFRLGDVSIDRKRLSFLEQLLVLLQLLLSLLQVGLDRQQQLLLGHRLVEVGDRFVEARRVGVDRDLEPILELGRDLIDLGLGLGQRLADLVPGRHGGLRGRLVCLGLCVQRLVQDLLGVTNALDGLIDAVLALRDRRVGILGALGQFRTQLICLTHQRVGLLVLLPAVSLPRLRFELGDLRDTLL